MNEYEARQEAKRQRLERAAEHAEARSTQAWKRSQLALDGIPFGQPILIGHHSEKRHRPTRNQFVRKFGNHAAFFARQLADTLPRQAAPTGQPEDQA